MKDTPSSMTRREFIRLSAFSVAAATVTGCATNPVTGERQFMLISQSGEVALDRDVSPKQFSSDYGQTQDAALTAYVSSVGSKLVAQSHRRDMPYSFRPVNAVYCNAYAFPGGSIGVTRGMLAELDDEAQLGALLGHELAHVNYRHTAQQMSRGLALQLALVGAGAYLGSRDKAEYADVVTALGGLGATMYLARYSRDHEREADKTGMDYLVKAGYDPGGMVNLMEVLTRLSGEGSGGAVSTLFATHPMSRERLDTARFRAGLAAVPGAAPTARNRDAYQAAASGVLRNREYIRKLQRGEEALGKKKLDEARTLIADGLRGMPDDYAGLLLLAKVAQAQQRPSEAESLAKRAAEIYPVEAQSRAVLAQALYARGSYESALASLSQYDRMLPGDPTVPFYAGLCHERMGNRRTAAQYYARFLRVAGSENSAPAVRHAAQSLSAWGYTAQ